MKELSLLRAPIVAAFVAAALSYANPTLACDSVLQIGATIPIDDTYGLWLKRPFERNLAAVGEVWWVNHRSPEPGVSANTSNVSEVQIPARVYSDGFTSAFSVPEDAAPGDIWIVAGIELQVVSSTARTGGESPSIFLSETNVREHVQPDNPCSIAAPLYSRRSLELQFDFDEADPFLYDLWLTSDLAASEPPDTPPGASLLTPENFPSPFFLATDGSYLLIVSAIHQVTGERQPPTTFLLELDEQKGVAGVYFSPSCGCSSQTDMAPTALPLLGLLFVKRRKRWRRRESPS